MHLSTLVTGCTAALFLSAHERRAAPQTQQKTPRRVDRPSRGQVCHVRPIYVSTAVSPSVDESRIISTIMLHMMFRSARSRVPLSSSVQSALRYIVWGARSKRKNEPRTKSSQTADNRAPRAHRSSYAQSIGRAAIVSSMRRGERADRAHVRAHSPV